MNAIPRVLHRTAKPVAVEEFYDALQATCPPRFPGSRGPHNSNPRSVALAISGGVDSMALAYLCSRSVRASSFRPTVADNPVGHFRCYIVDHRLREGSTAEAHAVVEVLKSLGLRSQYSTLSWTHILQQTGVAHPNDLPKLETLARRLRYNRLAYQCVVGNIASLFVAHHQDDQYETVLMRLMSGHGKAGLLGMRPATDIPECYDVHGAWKSGFVDDQMLPNPTISYRPTQKELAAARRQMREEMDPELIRRELQAGMGPGTMGEKDFDAYVPKTKWLLPAAPPPVEDGGVMVYRPLLEFSKDRLIATCEAAKIPWFEDATNIDPTLTTRNAVRHLVRNYTLPVALQKPAILEMSARLNRQNALDEAETMRLLARTVIRDFESTVGTVVVQLPSFRIPRLRKGQNNEAKRRKRLEHYRKIAALLVKKLIAIVTPEIQSSFATNLQNTVFRLFPSLHDKPSALPADPKSFNVSSVHFIPLRDPKHPHEPLKWYLTREPYVSDRPLPLRDWACLPLRQRWRRRPEQWRWPEWKLWRMWDGRFWVSLRNRTSVHAAVAPFEMKYAKAFRDALPDGRARDELMALMKLHAPGKVRYTLPAIYTAGDHLEAIRNYEERAEREKIKMREVVIGNATEWNAAAADEKEAFQKALQAERDIGLAKPRAVHWRNVNWLKLGNQNEQVDKVLVALPTLGIAKPGLNNWLRYELRYRKVDKHVLEKSLGDGKELIAQQKMRAKARARGLKRWLQRLSSQRRRSNRGGRRYTIRVRRKDKEW